MLDVKAALSSFIADLQYSTLDRSSTVDVGIKEHMRKVFFFAKSSSAMQKRGSGKMMRPKPYKCRKGGQCKEAWDSFLLLLLSIRVAITDV